MTLRLLGTVTTDSKGEATLSYVGNGRGLVQFVAKKGNLQSDTIEVLDCIFYDDGVTNPKPNIWTNLSENYTETIDNTGTLWTCTATVQFVANHSTLGSYFLDYESSWCLEMDVVSYNDVSIRIRQSANSYSNFTFSTQGVTQNCHLKIVYNGNNTITYTIDDNTPVTRDTSIAFTGNIGIGVRLNSASSSLKFKNFKIYPI